MMTFLLMKQIFARNYLVGEVFMMWLRKYCNKKYFVMKNKF